MNNNEKFYINITDVEMPDFFGSLTEKEATNLKKNVLQEINNRSNARAKVIAFRRKIISFIAAAVLLISSTTAIASITTQRKVAVNPKPTESTQQTEATQKPKKEKTPQLNDFSSDEDKNQNSNSFVPAVTTPTIEKPAIIYAPPEKTYVQVSCPDLQGYSMKNHKDGWYSFECTEGYLNDTNFECQVIWRDTGWSRDIIQSLGLERSTDFDPEYEQFYLDDYKAMYVKYPDTALYSQQLFVSYREYNYVLIISGGKGTNYDKFIELGRKVKLENATETDCSEDISLVDYFEHYSPDKLMNTSVGKEISLDDIYGITDSIPSGNCQITVENIESYDNISQFVAADTSLGGGMKPALVNNLALFVGADGNLSEYSRKVLTLGDGVMTPKEKIIAEYNTKQKFFAIRLKITNTTDTAQKFNADLPLIYTTETADGLFEDKTGYRREFLVELCQENSLPKYFSKNPELILEPEQEEIIEVGYFVDIDLHNKMMLSIKNKKYNNYIDLRQ